MTAERPTVTVVVPAFNEMPGLPDNLATLHEHLERLEGYDWDLVVVDDGSTDGTGDAADAFAKAHGRTTVVRHRKNSGLGRALDTGIRSSTGDFVVTFDADLSYSPSVIAELLECIQSTRASVVVASPYCEGGAVVGVPPGRLRLSRWANRYLSWLSYSGISTLTGMVRAYDGDFVRSIPIKAIGNHVNSEMIYKAEMLREPVEEIPATLTWTRPIEKTKTRFRPPRISTARSILDFAFSGFIFRPFRFFVFPGLVLLLLSAVSGIVLIADLIHFWIERGLFSLGSATLAALENNPVWAIAFVATTLLGAQLVSLGVISAQAKRYFEEQYMWMIDLSRED